MFSHPAASPPQETAGGEMAYLVAYLQALSPMESADSRYRLHVMDRDGSNDRALFPAAGEAGLDPQTVAWSPDGARIALIYRGDLWVVDAANGAGQPLTGDGQSALVDWKP
jgi:Tol biopolymer transport system component